MAAAKALFVGSQRIGGVSVEARVTAYLKVKEAEARAKPRP